MIKLVVLVVLLVLSQSKSITDREIAQQLMNGVF